jgi:hypothetical protein
MKPLETIAIGFTQEPHGGIELPTVINIDEMEEVLQLLRDEAQAMEDAARRAEMLDAAFEKTFDITPLDTSIEGLREFYFGIEQIGDGLSNIVVPALTEAQIEAQKLNDIFSSLETTLLKTFASTTVDTLHEVGRSMTDISEGAKSAKEAIEDWFISLLKAIPQAMLNAGLQALILNPADPRGWALVLGSGLLSFIGGVIAGDMDPTTATGSESNPSPDSVTREGVTSRGGTVTVNNFGNVFVRDEFDSSVVAANAAAAGNR